MKDCDAFNLTLLGKWRWKFLSRGNDLCSKIIWACYGQRLEDGGLSAKASDSIWWRDLLKTCFKKNAC